jgi:hypothetical protein
MRRTAAVRTGFVALLATTFSLVTGAPAFADPIVSVVGAAAVPTQPGTDELTYTIAIGNGPIDAVVLHAHQPHGLSADPTGVVVDGSPAPAGTVTQAGSGLTIRLGTGADATDGGTLATGNHTVTFDFAVPALPTGAASAYAVLDYAANGNPHEVRSTPVSLSIPGLRLTKPNGSGENRILPLGTGLDGDFEAIMTNSGGDAASATLTITLPAGLTIDRGFGVYRDDDYRSPSDTGGHRLDCTTPQDNVVRCALGAVDAGANALLDIPVQAQKSAPVGEVGTFVVNALADSGLDRSPSDNTVRGSVRFTGTAHLVASLRPTRLKVVVGKTGKLVATVHNRGPNTALKALGLIALRNDRFSIVGFSGRQLALGGSSGMGMLARAHWGARSPGTSPTAAATPSGTPFVLWNVGTIAPGKSAKSTITLKAITKGSDELLLVAASVAGDPSCQSETQTANCRAAVFAQLTAVKAAPKPTKSPGPTHTTSPHAPSSHHSGPILADTGPTDAQSLTLFGTVSIVVGAALLVLGSARPLRVRTRRH